jgi:hypothetical protein
MKRIALIFAAGLALAACGGGEKPADTVAAAPPAAPMSDVERALAVQRGLDAAPTQGDSVLQANGLTAAGFDSLLYRIASDSTLRAQFAAGR